MLADEREIGSDATAPWADRVAADALGGEVVVEEVFSAGRVATLEGSLVGSKNRVGQFVKDVTEFLLQRESVEIANRFVKIQR